MSRRTAKKRASRRVPRLRTDGELWLPMKAAGGIGDDVSSITKNHVSISRTMIDALGWTHGKRLAVLYAADEHKLILVEHERGFALQVPRDNDVARAYVCCRAYLAARRIKSGRYKAELDTHEKFGDCVKLDLNGSVG